MVRVSAPGKCILFGEHAVVYGHPAVAVAIDQRLTVSAELSSQWDIDGKPLNAQKHPHVEALKSRMWAHGPPLRVSIQGDIPAGSGLGSSASLSAASASCLRMLRGVMLMRMVTGQKAGPLMSQTMSILVIARKVLVRTDSMDGMR